MSIPTADSLRRTHRRLDRFRREVSRTLAAMKAGAVLNLHYQNGRPIWRLSSGPFVTSEAVAIVIASDTIVGAGNSLFPDHHQTWRYTQ